MFEFQSVGRCALFIDGPNLYSSVRQLGFELDYRRLLVYFGSRCNLVRASYYSALLETEDYSPVRPLTDWLAYYGFNFVTKTARETSDATGRRRVANDNMDVELAVDMLEHRQADQFIDLIDIAPEFTRAPKEQSFSVVQAAESAR